MKSPTHRKQSLTADSPRLALAATMRCKPRLRRFAVQGRAWSRQGSFTAKADAFGERCPQAGYPKSRLTTQAGQESPNYGLHSPKANQVCPRDIGYYPSSGHLAAWWP